jgi:hypothetical protein
MSALDPQGPIVNGGYQATHWFWGNSLVKASYWVIVALALQAAGDRQKTEKR